MVAAVQDKAGKNFWDDLWGGMDIPSAVNPQLPGAGNLFNRRLDALYHQIFAGIDTKQKTFLELGCAMSVWLPYFAKEFGFRVTGLDYSEIGCEQERQVLQKAEVQGEIICADFFNPPAELTEQFDYVYSSGVAEHFIPTERCLAAFASFLKPGGTMITIVPNLTGTVGWLTKACNRPVYDIHVLLENDDLQRAHEKAGLTVDFCRYFLSTGFGVANVSGLDQSSTATKIKKHLIKNLERLSVLIWMIENNSFPLPATKIFSPYVVCVARKPQVKEK